MDRVWDAVMRELDSVEAGSDERSITPTMSSEEIRRRLDLEFDFATPMTDDDVTEAVAGMLRGGIVDVTSRRYFGLFNPSIHRCAIIADTLTAAFNPQLAAYSHAPAAVEIEQHALRFLAGKLGFDPETCGASFTSGGAEANHSAVIAALARSFPPFVNEGVRSLTGQPAFYVSAEAHDSFRKVAQVTGIGRHAVKTVPVGTDLRMDVDALRGMLAADRASGEAPFMVVATAGTTAAGIIDPLPALADVAREEGLWFHVDAAWGGTACLSPRVGSCLAGIERADSVTWDAHKWLCVPMGAGMVFYADSAAAELAFSFGPTGYMPASVTGAVEPYLTSLQWSRRFIGLKVFMTAASLGEDGLAEMVERMATLGQLLRQRLETKGWRVVNRTPLPVVCFTNDRLDRDRDEAFTIASRLQNAGRAWISAALISPGCPVLRACITSFRTDEDDLDVLIEELERASAG